jgi:hypothetical protein
MTKNMCGKMTALILCELVVLTLSGCKKKTPETGGQ